MNNKFYFGKKFYQVKATGYWKSTTKPRIDAHRWIWINIHGPIPKGYHIHHKNEDKSDNRIENLELIEQSRHLSIHSSSPEHKQHAKEMAEKYRPLTKAWHASPEGIKWHRKHAILNDFGNWKPINYKCDNCGKDFKSKKLSGTKFCTNACKSASRRKKGLDDIQINCSNCNKSFTINKYSKTTSCSRSCAALSRWNKRTALL